MEYLLVKMPVEDYEALHPDMTEDWIVEERYEDSEEIRNIEQEIALTRQGLKDLYKAMKDLKHPIK